MVTNYLLLRLVTFGISCLYSRRNLSLVCSTIETILYGGDRLCVLRINANIINRILRILFRCISVVLESL